MKKIISVLLLCAMLCSAFASCASEDEGKTPASADTTTASDGVVTEAGTETKPDYLGQLEAIDYGGRDYNILCRDSKIYEVWAEAEMGETINDALGAESKASVIPDFYETVLKGKVARDNDSEAMLDLIRDALYFDFGFVHAVSINGLFQFFGDKLQEGTENFASAYEKQSKAFNKAFEKVLDAYMKVTG